MATIESVSSADRRGAERAHAEKHEAVSDRAIPSLGARATAHQNLPKTTIEATAPQKRTPSSLSAWGHCLSLGYEPGRQGCRGMGCRPVEPMSGKSLSLII
jgi:hypothetical protein